MHIYYFIRVHKGHTCLKPRKHIQGPEYEIIYLELLRLPVSTHLYIQTHLNSMEVDVIPVDVIILYIFFAIP